MTNPFKISTNIKFRRTPTLEIAKAVVQVPMNFNLAEPSKVEFSLRFPAQQGQPVHMRLYHGDVVVLNVNNDGITEPTWKTFALDFNEGSRALQFRFEPRTGTNWPEPTGNFYLGGLRIGVHQINLQRWLTNQTGTVREWAWNEPATSLELSYDTVEDYHPILESPVVSNGELLRVVQDLGGVPRTELVAIDKSGKLAHFKRDPSSASGWSHDLAPIPGAPIGQPVSRLMAFYEDRILHVFVHFRKTFGQTTVALERRPGGEWVGTKLSPEVAELLATTSAVRVYRDERGTHFVHGLGHPRAGESHGFMLSRGREGGWQINWRAQVPNNGKTQHHVLPGTSEEPLMLLTIQDSEDDPARFEVVAGRILDGKFVAGGEPRRVMTSLGNGVSVRKLIPLHNPNRQINWIIQSTNNEYFILREIKESYGYRVDLQRWRFPKRPGESAGKPVQFTQIEAGLAGHRAVVFGTDSGRPSLWICRQAAPDANGATFQPWSELGDTPLSFGVPAHMLNGPELFLVNTEQCLEHMSQDIEDPSRPWHSRLVATPSPSTTKVHKTTSHAVEVRLRGAHGSPAMAIPIRIYTSRPVFAWIDGATHHVGPNTPLETTTNRTGRATIKLIGSGFTGSGLTAPRVGVQVPDLGPDIKWMSPDLALHERLTGTQPGFEVTKDELRKRGLISRKLDDEHADHVVDAVKRAGRQMVDSHSGSLNASGLLSAGTLGTQGWEFDFDSDHPTGVHVRPASREEIDQLTATLASGDLLDADAANLLDWLGDLLRKAGNFIEDVVKVVVHFVEDTVNLAIHFLEEVGNVVVRGAAAIANVLELLFQRLAHAFEEVIDAVKTTLDWLRVVFEWNDIKITKDVIKTHVHNNLRAIAHALDEPAVHTVKTACTKLKSELHAQFTSWHQWFDNRQKSLLAIGADTGRKPNPVQDRTTHDAFAKHALRCNFVQHHSDAHFEAEQQPDTQVSFDLDHAANNPFLEFIQELRQHVTDDGYQEEIAKLQTWLRGIHDVNSLINGGFHVVLGAVELVLKASVDIAEAVVVLLLRLLSRAFEWLDEMLTAPIEIPVLSQLYREAIGNDMSLLDLVCLGVAIPTTVLYKLTNANAAPFTKQQLDRLVAAGPLWTKLPDLLPRSAPSQSAIASLDTDIYTEISKGLGYASGIMMLIFVPMDCAMDIASAENVDLPPLVPLAFTLYQLTVQALGMPISIIKDIIEGKQPTGLEITAIAFWGVSWIPGVLDLICNGATAISTNRKVVKCVRQISVVGPAISCAFGIPSLAPGVAGLILALQSNPQLGDVLDGIGATVAPIPGICKVCIPIIQAGPPYSKAAYVVLLGCDFLAGGIAAACTIISAAQPAANGVTAGLSVSVSALRPSTV